MALTDEEKRAAMTATWFETETWCNPKTGAG